MTVPSCINDKKTICSKKKEKSIATFSHTCLYIYFVIIFVIIIFYTELNVFEWKRNKEVYFFFHNSRGFIRTINIVLAMHEHKMRQAIGESFIAFYLAGRRWSSGWALLSCELDALLFPSLYFRANYLTTERTTDNQKNH